MPLRDSVDTYGSACAVSCLVHWWEVIVVAVMVIKCLLWCWQTWGRNVRVSHWPPSWMVCTVFFLWHESRILCIAASFRCLSHITSVYIHDSTWCLARIIRYPNSVRPSVRLSVCLYVMTQYRFKPRWDRGSRFLPYDNIDSLVSCEKILCRWVRRFPLNEGIK